MSAELIGDLKIAYNKLKKGDIQRHIEPLYSADIVFVDPANRIEGRQRMLEHFESLYENLSSCTFEYHDQDCITSSDSALLVWTMQFNHKRLAGGKTIQVEGSTLLRFHNQIFYHRDWFDLGEMLYENLPIVGGLVKSIKRKLQ